MQAGPSDALVTADRHGFFKYMASALAEKHGMRATFMPKPFINLSGNGCHVHHSLWRGDEEVFLNRFRVGSTGEDVRGLDLSAEAYHWLGGLLDHAPAMCALTNPTVNSYKRINAPVTVSRHLSSRLLLVWRSTKVERRRPGAACHVER